MKKCKKNAKKLIYKKWFNIKTNWDNLLNEASQIQSHFPNWVKIKSSCLFNCGEITRQIACSTHRFIKVTAGLVKKKTHFCAIVMFEKLIYKKWFNIKTNWDNQLNEASQIQSHFPNWVKIKSSCLFNCGEITRQIACSTHRFIKVTAGLVKNKIHFCAIVMFEMPQMTVERGSPSRKLPDWCQ